MSAVVLENHTVLQTQFTKQSPGPKIHWWIKLPILSDAAERARSRTIIVCGLPVYVTEECIKRIFGRCGPIKKVSLYSPMRPSMDDHLPHMIIPMGFQEATVLFAREDSVKNALAMPLEDDYFVHSAPPKPMSQIWAESIERGYRMDLGKLKEQCTAYMKTFDASVEDAHKQSVEQARTTDEGGWTLVTRTKHKKPPKAVKAHEHHKLQAKSQRKSLLHFYKHTVNDTKMQRIKELKARFEEDKKRIQEMRQQRKFRPY